MQCKNCQNDALAGRTYCRPCTNKRYYEKKKLKAKINRRLTKIKALNIQITELFAEIDEISKNL